ncbi:MAG: hypothetical protein GY730_05245 [bacterium]|nr:hypothetical protein [bacterium]
MRKLIMLAICSLFFIGGCSVKYTVTPVEGVQEYTGEICVIEDPTVNDEFLPAYKSLLKEKGFNVKIIPAGSPEDSCELTSTYLGKWSWDFILYMAYGKIVVYKNGNKIGEALYEAPRAGWALTTKIYEKTKVKIRGMVDQLFPNINN